jgi:xanthine dehydrogenase/oxidase
MSDSITFFINGQKHVVTDVDPLMTLNEYIRAQPNLKGTKVSCQEGGCGACTVMVSELDVATSKVQHVSANSCLRPLASMNGAVVTTIEGIGGQQGGSSLAPLQQAIVEQGGTQCGFCTSGMIMQMASLVSNGDKPSQDQIELSFGGSLCRCTAYFPILKAFRQFASDASEVFEGDAVSPPSSFQCCGKGGANGGCCRAKSNDGEKTASSSSAASSSSSMCSGVIALDDGQRERVMAIARAEASYSKNGVDWHHATSLANAFELIGAATAASKSYRVVVANTSTGIFKDQRDDVLIDIKDVPELLVLHKAETAIEFGAAVPLEQLGATLAQARADNPTYETAAFPRFVEHLTHVAGVQVRNVGCWAGNLMLAHDRGFPSDVMMLLIGIGAQVRVASSATMSSAMSVMDFLSLDMSDKLLLSVSIPYASSAAWHFRSFRVAERKQNSHAYVNCGMSIQFEAQPAGSTVVAAAPVLAFGGIGSRPVLASDAAQYLVGKDLRGDGVLAQAMQRVTAQVKVTPGVELEAYKSSLVANFFYKFYLSVLPDAAVSPRIASAAAPFERPLSTSNTSWRGATDPSEFPVSDPSIRKLEGVDQVSGRVRYADDLSTRADALYGAVAVSQVARADIASVDVSDALAMVGVEDVLLAADIPGANSCGMNDAMSPAELRQQVLADGRVVYAGQPIALVLADSYRHARDAAAAVRVQYANVETPVLTISHARAANSYYPSLNAFYTVPMGPVTRGDVESGMAAATHVVQGTYESGAQMHFHLEQQTTVAEPGERAGSVQLHCATQSIAFVHSTVSSVLGVGEGLVEVHVNKLGGAYGGKIENATSVACLAALAAAKHNRPAHVSLDIETAFQMEGKRNPVQYDYKVGFDDQGQLQAIDMRVYVDGGAWNGSAFNNIIPILSACDGVYNCPNFRADGIPCYTNTVGNTYARVCFPKSESTHRIE